MYQIRNANCHLISNKITINFKSHCYKQNNNQLQYIAFFHEILNFDLCLMIIDYRNTIASLQKYKSSNHHIIDYHKAIFNLYKTLSIINYFLVFQDIGEEPLSIIRLIKECLVSGQFPKSNHTILQLQFTIIPL